MEACFLQDQKPVYFDSKALTEAQRDCVAIKFRVLGCGLGNGKIPPLSIHKPFYSRDRSEAPRIHLVKKHQSSHPRLQRILIRTFLYHFTMRYIPGLTNQLPDFLFRLGGQKDTIKLPKLHLYQITSQLKASSDSLHQLRLATQEDDVLALLKYTITQGWPGSIKQVPSEL